MKYLYLLLMIVMGCQAPDSGDYEKPNFLFIIADDLGARLGCYGDPDAVTPCLDRLAQQGILFKNCFTQFPSCGPSRASMLSGLYPFETGNISNGIPYETNKGFISLPRLFRQRGYVTARVGKIFHMPIPGGIGQAGTDDAGAWDVAINNSGWDGLKKNYSSAKMYKSKKPGTAVGYLSPDIKDEAMADGRGTQEALRLMVDKHPLKTGKPLMLFVGYYRPHPPLISPKSHWDQIDFSAIMLPQVPADDRKDIPKIAFQNSRSSHNHIPESVGLSYSQAYHAAVNFIDSEVAKLLAGLKKNSLDKNTIIVFTGDQGFHLGEHHHWHKSTFFEQACRVPLIIKDPRTGIRGKTSEGLCGLIDLYPTLCELAEIKPQHELSGKSLVPRLKKPTLPGKKMELTQWKLNGVSVRDIRYRYSEWSGGEKGSMLYDLQNDPHEFHNLVTVPEHAETVSRMKSLLSEIIDKNSGMPNTYKVPLVKRQKNFR